METKLVNYKLPLDLISDIEKMSTGNKTALVVDLLKQSMSMRRIPEQERQRMYSAIKRYNQESGINEFFDDPNYSRDLIDGLWI